MCNCKRWPKRWLEMAYVRYCKGIWLHRWSGCNWVYVFWGSWYCIWAWAYGFTIFKVWEWKNISKTIWRTVKRIWRRWSGSKNMCCSRQNWTCSFAHSLSSKPKSRNKFFKWMVCSRHYKKWFWRSFWYQLLWYGNRRNISSKMQCNCSSYWRCRASIWTKYYFFDLYGRWSRNGFKARLTITRYGDVAISPNWSLR